MGGWYQDVSCQGATWEVPLVLLVRPINDQEALCTRHTSCLQQHHLQHSQHIQVQSKPALHLPHWTSLNNVSMWSGCVCLGWYVNLLGPWSNWLDQSNILSQLFHYIIKTICAQSYDLDRSLSTVVLSRDLTYLMRRSFSSLISVLFAHAFLLKR